MKGFVLKCQRYGSEFDVITRENLKGPRIPFGKATDLNGYGVAKEGEGFFIDS